MEEHLHQQQQRPPRYVNHTEPNYKKNSVSEESITFLLLLHHHRGKKDHERAKNLRWPHVMVKVDLKRIYIYVCVCICICNLAKNPIYCKEPMRQGRVNTPNK